MRKAIVIPCYNEANRLKFDEFQNFINHNSDYLLCFVNDGSKDETLDELNHFMAKNPTSVVVHDLAQNSGKAEAVRSGIQFMINTFDLENVGFLDADLATGFDDYKRLEAELNSDSKMVIGSRKMEEGDQIERSFFRKTASWAIGYLINLIIGLPIKDTQCGAKVFENSLAHKLFEKPFLSRWLFDVELFIRLKKQFNKRAIYYVKEVALLAWEEVDGSKITLKDSMKFPMALLEIGYDYNIKPRIVTINNSINALRLVFRPAA